MNLKELVMGVNTSRRGLDVTSSVSTNRYEPYPNGLVRNNSDWNEFRELPNDFELLMRYTKWLDRRGFFREDLQCDFEHQIHTFLNDFNVDNLLNELNK